MNIEVKCSKCGEVMESRQSGAWDWECPKCHQRALNSNGALIFEQSEYEDEEKKSCTHCL